MKLLSFTEARSSESYHDLIRALGRPDSANNIRIDQHIGTGHIRFFELEPGLHVRIWDCTFTEGLQIDRQSNPESDNRSFNLVYYITPGSYTIEDREQARAG